MKIDFELMPQHDWQVLKVIKVEGSKWNPFIGFLPYQRKMYTGYNSVEGDEMDESILNTIQAAYPNSTLHQNEVMVFKGQMDTALKSIELVSKKKLELNFFPKIKDDMAYIMDNVGKLYQAYLFPFQLRISLNENDPRCALIHEAELCYIPSDLIDRRINTITAL